MERLLTVVVEALDREYRNSDLEVDVTPEEIAATALAALGLDDLDAAVHRANIDHPHTGLPIGTDCARAVLEAALLPEEQTR